MLNKIIYSCEFWCVHLDIIPFNIHRTDQEITRIYDNITLFGVSTINIKSSESSWLVQIHCYLAGLMTELILKLKGPLSFTLALNTKKIFIIRKTNPNG